MSLLRTGHTPDAWRDEGPAAHVALHARIGGSLVTPFDPSPSMRRQAEAERSKARRATNKAKPFVEASGRAPRIMRVSSSHRPEARP